MGRIFFTGVNLVDGDNPACRNVTVVVSGERIAAVAREQDAPRPETQDTVIALGGKTLMPGMYTTHFHCAYLNIELPIHVDIWHPPAYLAMVGAEHAKLALSYGYTGVVSAGAPHDIDVALRDAINDGIFVGPRMMPCSAYFTTTGDNAVDFHPYWLGITTQGLVRVCDGPEEFRKAVRREIKTGVQMIKVYPTGGHGFPKEQPLNMSIEEQVAIVNTAHERGVKVRGHVGTREGITTAVKLGYDLIDHANAIDDECLELMSKQRTFVAPSLNIYVRDLVLKPGEPVPDRKNWMDRACEYWKEMLPKCEAAGVRLLHGDDYGTSADPHGNYAKEFEYYVKLGAKPLDVVRWATKNGADVMGRLNDLGTITTGKLADLLVVDGDPLADVTILQDRANLSVIMKGGAFVKNVLAGTAIKRMD